MYFLRFALAASYLSAVADRFGIWGTAGEPNVVWGNFESFTSYTGMVNSFMPAAIIPALAWIATIAEVIIAILLMIGWKLKYTALASGVLLATFFIGMTISFGVKAPLDYSVFTACAASFLLATNASKKS